MRYVGGKSKIAKEIVSKIRANTSSDVIYEPFMGGGSVTAQLAKCFSIVKASDNSADIALLWDAAINGWEAPEFISERQYYELMNEEPSALRGLAGFGGSFGGKWFAGYARGGFTSTGEPRNHQGESARAVNRIAGLIRSNTSVIQSDYLSLEIESGCAVYCDPPYADTLGYESDFSTSEFWSWATDLSTRCDVFVSEYKAPDGWTEIWNKQKRQSVTLPSQGREVRIERLFTR